MPRRQITPKITKVVVITVITLLVPAGYFFKHGSSTGNAKTPSSGPLSSNDELVYSDDHNDSWNRVFHSLFTRKFKARVSDAFPEHGPFVALGDGMSGARVSTRIFDRFENGDRAIEPLYPSFLNDDGPLRVLKEPDYSALKHALVEALEEKHPRSTIARALMQSDVWAAYDILFAKRVFSSRQRLLNQRRKVLLSLLARFTWKLALTPQEIQKLPDNYSAAYSRFNLPEIFAPESEWIEIQMSPHRLHDFATDFRRSARVFVRLEDKAVDKRSLLEKLRNENFFPLLNSLVLVMQNLLVDTKGNAVPGPLTTELQIRRFNKDLAGKVISTELRQYELSRRSLLRNPGSGGLMEMRENGDVYLPVSGNDYFFASPQFTSHGTDYPVLASLRQRCEGCHGPGATRVFTLSTHDPIPLPPITLLPPLANVHGWYVAGRKQERADFKALLRQK